MVEIPADLRFATCSFHQFRPQYGIGVRTSIGWPRPPYRDHITSSIPAVTPSRDMLGLDQNDYRRLYVAKVDRLWDEFVANAVAIHRAHAAPEGKPLVLLCFESLGRPGRWCHRRMLADIIGDRLDIDVPELGAQPPEAGDTLW